MPFHSEMYFRWYADNIWIFVPVGGKVKAFLRTIPDYPFQEGGAIDVANINYNTLKAAGVLKRLQELQEIQPAGD